MKNKIWKGLALVFILTGFQISLFGQSNLKDLIKGEKGRSSSSTRLTPEQQVIFHPSDAKQLLGIDQESDLVLTKTVNDKLGQTHLRYSQVFRNYQVENSMYVMHVTNGKLTGMNGTIILDFGKLKNRPSAVSISKEEAILAAKQFVHAEKYAWEDAGMENQLRTRSGNIMATYYPVASLVWYSPRVEIDAADLHLAYKIDVYALKPLGRAFYYVDAATGKLLGSKDELFYTDAVGTANTAYSGIKTIHSDFNGSNYTLEDFTKGNGIYTVHATTGTDYLSATADWNLSGADQYALDVHYGVSQTYDFYFTNYGRNSVDDLGLPLVSYVNEGIVDNAYWDGSYMHFGVRSVTGNGVTAIDITAHELTHGVTQYTNNMLYYLEPGAMNESMSDIMGKSVQFWSKPTDVNWLLSNDMGWNLRSMSNPKLYHQPNTYHGTYWYSGGIDHGGVHTNSGVGNYMFYLLVNGGSDVNDLGHPYTVSGIGLTKADAIIYRTETVYLTTLSQYSDWRDACVSAATDLYGAGSNEVIQVENAWYAVGIGTAGMPSCIGTPVAGTISPASVQLCVSGSTTFTLSGYPSTVSGITLQWRTSTNRTTFTNVAGAVFSTYTTPVISTTRYYQCMVSCAGGGVAYTDTIKVTVSPNVTAGLSISANPPGTVCAVSKVVFTAVPVNGGSAPVYQWKKNGITVGAGSSYADSVWATSDVVNCVMISNAPCVSGNPASASVTMNVNTCYDTLSLRMFIQGFYLGGDSMIAVVDPVNATQVCDSVTVELHEATSPFDLVYVVKGVLTTHGNAIFRFPDAVYGRQYYVVIRHRNSIETWSKTPVTFNSFFVSLDFTRP